MPNHFSVANQPCSVEACDRLIGRNGAKGMCARHYTRFLRHGSPSYRGTHSNQHFILRPMPDRFWFFVNKNGSIPEERPDLGPCWLWTGNLNQNGYGRFTTGRKKESAHRIAYVLVKGPIADGYQIDHLCFNRRCVNPSHLEQVTRAENDQRRMARRLALQVAAINPQMPKPMIPQP